MRSGLGKCTRELDTDWKMKKEVGAKERGREKQLMLGGRGQKDEILGEGLDWFTRLRGTNRFLKVFLEMLLKCKIHFSLLDYSLSKWLPLRHLATDVYRDDNNKEDNLKRKKKCDCCILRKLQNIFQCFVFSILFFPIEANNQELMFCTCPMLLHFYKEMFLSD